MILEPSTDFDQIWSIMSKVLWLNFCILLCAFDTYGECICFSLTSRRCSFLLWHFNFASHRICSEMGQVGSSSFSVRKQSCCLSADTKTIVGLFLQKKTFQVHSCGLNQAIAISGGVHPCALELVILIYLRWLHWPGGAQHRGWQLGLGMVGDFCFLGHFCCFAISWYIFKFQISRGHGSRLCASSKIIVQWYIFQRGKAQVARDGCSEALSGSDVNGTNMQGCHDQSGGDQIDNHNHNLNHNHE